MNTQNKLFCFLLFFISSVCLAESPVIRVAEFIHPPFAYIDSQTQTPKGYEIEFITKTLQSFGMRVQFTFYPHLRMIKSLKQGEADIGALLIKTKEREEFLYFSDKPGFILDPVLIVNNNSHLKILQDPSDLEGMSIGFVSGMQIPRFIEQAKLKRLDLATGYDMSEQNIKKLMAKHLDGVVDLNSYNTSATIKKWNLSSSVRILKIPNSKAPCYWTISKKSPYAKQLLELINKKNLMMNEILKHH